MLNIIRRIFGPKIFFLVMKLIQGGLVRAVGYRSRDTRQSRQIDTVTYRLANNTETLAGRDDMFRSL